MARICKDIDCVVEVFGRCRGEYCTAERRGLIERARQEARRLGHSLSPFEKVKDHAIWKARCEDCDLEAAVTLSAKPGEPEVYGEALSKACVSRQAG